MPKNSIDRLLSDAEWLEGVAERVEAAGRAGHYTIELRECAANMRDVVELFNRNENSNADRTP